MGEHNEHVNDDILYLCVGFGVSKNAAKDGKINRRVK